MDQGHTGLGTQGKGVWGPRRRRFRDPGQGGFRGGNLCRYLIDNRISIYQKKIDLTSCSHAGTEDASRRFLYPAPGERGEGPTPESLLSTNPSLTKRTFR